MAFSTQRAVSDGTLTNLNVSIGYLKQADIQVFFDDLPAAPGTWAWVGATPVINFTPVVPNGVEVLLKRSTQISSVINLFTAGAGFTNKAMDTNSKQFLYLNQEAVEGAALTDVFSDVDFHGYRIRNIGAATLPSDAVTLSQYQADVGTYVTQATTQAGIATTQAGIATTKANEAAVSADAAAASAAAAAATVAPVIVAAPTKATPIDADSVPLVDSAAGNALKRVTWANVKATLKSYFDTLYAAASSVVSPATVAPLANGTAAVGTATKYAREDHVHPGGAQKIINVVEATPHTAYSSAADAGIFDDTIPQLGEGTSLMSVTITPTSATSRLRVEFLGNFGNNSGGNPVVVAMYRDSTANAVTAGAVTLGVGYVAPLPLVYEVAAGSTSATTFSIRFSGSGCTAYVNGTSGARRFGGVQAATLRVTEIAA